MGDIDGHVRYYLRDQERITRESIARDVPLVLAALDEMNEDEIMGETEHEATRIEEAGDESLRRFSRTSVVMMVLTMVGILVAVVLMVVSVIGGLK